MNDWQTLAARVIARSWAYWDIEASILRSSQDAEDRMVERIRAVIVKTQEIVEKSHEPIA